LKCKGGNDARDFAGQLRNYCADMLRGFLQMQDNCFKAYRHSVADISAAAYIWHASLSLLRPKLTRSSGESSVDNTCNSSNRTMNYIVQDTV
jgi:hypothetical protein